MRNRIVAILLMLLGALLGVFALKPQSMHVVTPNGTAPPSSYLLGAILGHLLMGALSVASFIAARRIARHRHNEPTSSNLL